MARLALLCAVFLVAVPAFAQPLYLVTDLVGVLGDGVVSAGKINNAGVVVGTYDTGATSGIGDPVWRAFVWLPGPAQGLPAGFNELGTLGGPTSTSRATDVNELGLISGYSGTGQIVGVGEETVGFVWQAGAMTGLPSVTTGFDIAWATAINRHGETAGLEGSGFGCHPLLWLPGPTYGLPSGPNILGPLPGGPSEGLALDLNDLGQVVGEMRFACDVIGDSSAFLWLPEPAYGLPAGMNDLTAGMGMLTFAAAQAINESGQIAGQIDQLGVEFSSELFLWQEGQLTRLGALPEASFTSASDINNQGQIVGTSGSRAVLWDGGTLYNLNDLIPAGSGWLLTNATGINDHGQIVGVGVFDGTRRLFRLDDATLVFADGFESGNTSAW